MFLIGGFGGWCLLMPPWHDLVVLLAYLSFWERWMSYTWGEPWILNSFAMIWRPGRYADIISSVYTTLTRNDTARSIRLLSNKSLGLCARFDALITSQRPSSTGCWALGTETERFAAPKFAVAENQDVILELENQSISNDGTFSVGFQESVFEFDGDALHRISHSNTDLGMETLSVSFLGDHLEILWEHPLRSDSVSCTWSSHLAWHPAFGFATAEAICWGDQDVPGKDCIST